MSVCFSTWAYLLPEHDRYIYIYIYSLEFLYSSRSTCFDDFDVGPMILYCFLCSPHFVEMPVARPGQWQGPSNFVEIALCPSTICRGTTVRPHEANFKGLFSFLSAVLHFPKVSLSVFLFHPDSIFQLASLHP